MARTNRKEVDEKEKAPEPPSHKKRREVRARIHELPRTRDWDEEEFETFEPLKRKKR